MLLLERYLLMPWKKGKCRTWDVVQGKWESKGQAGWLLHPPAPPVIWSWVLWFAVFANNGSMSYHASGPSGLLVLSVSEMAGFVGSCATQHPLSEMRIKKRAFQPPSHPTVPKKAHDLLVTRLILKPWSVSRQMIIIITIIIIIIHNYLQYEYGTL